MRASQRDRRSHLFGADRGRMVLACVRYFGVMACLVLLGACEISNPSGPTGDAEEELKRAELRWQQRGFMSYRYVSTVSCFCGSVGPAEVTVVNGAVTSVVRRVDGVRQPTTSRQSVDSLFAFVRSELTRFPERLRVTYDRTLGYPREINWGTPENDGGGFIGSDSVRAIP